MGDEPVARSRAAFTREAPGPADARSGWVETSLGPVRVEWRGDTLTRVDLALEPGDGMAAGRPFAPRAIADRLAAAVDGGDSEPGPVDLTHLTPFQQDVLRVVAAIPRGEVRPYGWVAAMAGRPRAARAVGRAVAANPVPLVIPCHRVTRSSGEIGAYSGGGPGIKARILRHEGVDIEALAQLVRRGARFVGDPTAGTFCWPTCHQLGLVPPTRRILLPNWTSALQAGLKPCARCRPLPPDRGAD